MQDTVAPVFTRHRAAVAALNLASLTELPFANETNFAVHCPTETDLAVGFESITLAATPKTPNLSDDSDSDFEYYPPAYSPITMPSVLSSFLDESVTYAKWKPSTGGMPGTMTVGKITIETLEAAKKDLRIFLTNNRKLIPADYVSRCLNVWEDPRVSNWIEQNREKFSELSFEDFFIAVRDRVLDPDWRDSTFRKMRAVHMPDDLSTSASDLAVSLLILNGYLKGTRSYQSDESLKSMLEAAIDPGLYHAYTKEVEDQSSNPGHGIHSKDFDTFTRALQSLDHSRHIQLRMARQMAEQMIRSRPGSRATTPFNSSSAANRPAQRQTNGSTVGSQNTVPRGRLPPLTATERRLLGENDGCFKCRSFFVKCRTSSEEHEFAIPNGTGYKELTVADVEAARKLRGPNQDGHKKPRIATTVATIGTEDDDDVVASIIPSAVLGSGTDSEEET
ncbi:hypothetical protein C8R41DRAFT_785955 [Lentinula lateritia]|uniref:Uncharacterized protein n=1 Tax=Lentinula lateritia TaxID=40482 RepID=A0ABQ8W119_9AGAR|nr:hypothetical protein C8R41DRAFT_785955 [Lentinula lateritia]